MHCVQASLFCTPRCHISALIFTGGVLSVQSCWGCDTSVVFYVKVHCVSVCFHHIVAFYYLWPPPLVFVSSLHVFFFSWGMGWWGACPVIQDGWILVICASHFFFKLTFNFSFCVSGHTFHCVNTSCRCRYYMPCLQHFMYYATLQVL